MNKSWLRTASRAIWTVSVATQLLTVAYYWWNFDPRLSCDRLPYWTEWLNCLHAPFHTDVIISEVAIGVLLIAGLTVLLGRYLPAYVSVLLPLICAIAAIWAVMKQWQEQIYFYGE